MTPEVYEMAMDLSTRVGKLLGTIGALVKYDNPDIPNFEFRQLAKTYIECSTTTTTQTQTGTPNETPTPSVTTTNTQTPTPSVTPT